MAIAAGETGCESMSSSSSFADGRGKRMADAVGGFPVVTNEFTTLSVARHHSLRSGSRCIIGRIPTKDFT